MKQKVNQLSLRILLEAADSFLSKKTFSEQNQKEHCVVMSSQWMRNQNQLKTIQDRTQDLRGKKKSKKISPGPLNPIKMIPTVATSGWGKDPCKQKKWLLSMLICNPWRPVETQATATTPVWTKSPLREPSANPYLPPASDTLDTHPLFGLCN